MKRLALLALLLLVTPLAHAQITVSPIMLEGRVHPHQKAKGQFTVTNNNLTAVNVVIESKRTLLDENQIRYVDPDPKTIVHVNPASTRIGIKQTFTFDYDITTETLPTVVTFVVKMTPGQHVNSGTQIGFVIPVRAWLCAKPSKEGCRKDILAAWHMMAPSFRPPTSMTLTPTKAK